jgi:hypothetical protein
MPAAASAAATVLRHPLRFGVAMSTLAALALAGADTTWAATSASAQIGPVSWVLTPIDPDGPAPSFELTVMQTYSSAAATGQPADVGYADGLYATTERSRSNPLAAATARTGSGGGEAVSNVLGSSAPGLSNLSSSSAYPVLANVLIGPNTQISLMALGSGSATTTLGRVGDFTESASATATLQLTWLDTLGGRVTHVAQRMASANWQGSVGSWSGTTQSFSGIVHLVAVNHDTTAVAGNFYVYASAVGNTRIAAPVPEPGTWALLAAGLAVVGGVARRRPPA